MRGCVKKAPPAGGAKGFILMHRENTRLAAQRGEDSQSGKTKRESSAQLCRIVSTLLRRVLAKRPDEERARVQHRSRLATGAPRGSHTLASAATPLCVNKSRINRSCAPTSRREAAIHAFARSSHWEN